MITYDYSSVSIDLVRLYAVHCNLWLPIFYCRKVNVRILRVVTVDLMTDFYCAYLIHPWVPLIFTCSFPNHCHSWFVVSIISIFIVFMPSDQIECILCVWCHIAIDFDWWKYMIDKLYSDSSSVFLHVLVRWSQVRHKTNPADSSVYPAHYTQEPPRE